MESHLCAPADFMDDLLDFASDFVEAYDGDDDLKGSGKTLILRSPTTPGIVEEELEWITNKDAFPTLESFVDIIPNHSSQQPKAESQQSPVSVLENSRRGPVPAVLNLPCSLKVPVRARSNSRKRRRETFGGMQWQVWAKEARKPGRKKGARVGSGAGTVGKKCQHCQSEKTPQWRAGPTGPKTLCNACGVRYKSGRLVPEYRPASSPTFSSEVHSNSHRKIIEMRRQMQMQTPRVLQSRPQIG